MRFDFFKKSQKTKVNWLTNQFGDKVFMKTAAKLFFPAILEVIILSSVNYFDSLFIALFTPDNMGAAAKTATVLATQLMFLPTIFFYAIVAAAGILAAQYYGKRDYLRFKETINFMLLFGSIVVVIFVIIYMVVPLEMIQLYSGNTLDDSASEEAKRIYDLTNHWAASYLRWQSLTLIPYMFTFSIATAYRQHNNAIMPLISSSIAVLVNIILDPVLIKYCATRSFEAILFVAIATIIARCIDAGIMLVLTLFRKSYPYYFFNHLKLSKRVIKLIFIHGWQVLVNEILFSVGTTIILMFYTRYSQDHRDAISTVTLIIQFTNLIWPGAASTVAVLVLANLGANKHDLAKENTRKLINWGIVVGVSIGIILLILSTFVNQLLNPPLDYTEQGLKQAAHTATIAMYLEWIVIMVVLTQGPYSVIYFCIRGGGSRWLLTIDCLSTFIWLIIMGCVTHINVPENYSDRLHVVLLFFIMESQNISKLIMAIVIFKKTNWAQNLVDEEKVITSEIGNEKEEKPKKQLESKIENKVINTNSQGVMNEI
ncbi:MATE family efflux transporter [Ureaplasma urealyticum]|uniref:MATE family efflux transporter n=1 Tax=Ureaplasma urealyticum TaxID=2130 RepID=UPI0001793CE1|nr:MATE family efflux transporter [Ureaplasma urealyticum]EDX53264.1 dna damage inducible protein - mate transporter family [Ureaplasma urealyticum serovar 12 str. ATCC 33696]EDY74835.1 dna damage inducible protein - mate transporter family [Ureaplasma urealyticum serovar 4 str. ATCC 27816]MDU3864625.1 MATE family efflux transporter [Ureaplasma urealyticum]UIU15052.1 MATE family efflux transporter [Ureaplasma urealyticum]